MHVWRPFDSFFRLITARRNPNLVILTVSALFGRPDIGMQIVAAWVLICFVIHGVVIVQGLLAKHRGALTSWLAACGAQAGTPIRAATGIDAATTSGAPPH